MVRDIYLSFLIQVVSVLVIYSIISKHIKLPLIVRILTLLAYITTPIAKIFSGVASLLYLADLFPIFLLFYIFIRPKIVIRLYNNLFFLILFSFLIVVPLVTTCILVIEGNYFPIGREMMEMGIWFYRNINLLITFGVGICVSLNSEGIKDFIKINIVLGLLLGCLGILNYTVSPINMSTFEIILWQESIPEWYQNIRVTLGFLGLFRSSVGQWFAMLALLSVGTYGIWERRFSFIQIVTIVISIIIVILSGSRAGLVGLMIGMFMFLILQKRKAIGIVLIFISLMLIFSFFFNSESSLSIIWARYHIFQNEDISTKARMLALQEGVKYLLSDVESMLLGVGATNLERVYEISGLYGLHNEYIGFIFRGGLLGFILIIVFESLILKKFLGLISKVDKNILLIVNTIIVITVVNMIIALSQSFLIQDYATYIVIYYIYLLYGVFIGAKWTPYKDNYNLERVKYNSKGGKEWQI
jgi:O-antigen ligase